MSPQWRYIHTHFGIGYRFASEPASGHPAPEAPPALGPAIHASERRDELDLVRA